MGHAVKIRQARYKPVTVPAVAKSKLTYPSNS